MLIPYVTPKEIYAASIALPFLGIVLVFLRFYARTLKKNSIGLDDWLMLPALILLIGMGTSLFIGVHTKTIAYPIPPTEQLTHGVSTVPIFSKIGFAYHIFKLLEFGIIKLSIILYYRRIFVLAEGYLFDWITKAIITIVIIWTVGFLFANIFACGLHIFANWSTFEVSLRHCSGSSHIVSAFVISDLITDVLVLCLPLPTVWTFQMSIKKRLIVTGIFATGAVSTVASIIKAIILIEIMNGVFEQSDLYLASSTMVYWALIEGGLAIIAACLPTVRIVVGTASLSSILHRLRRALGWSSVDSQNQELQQISRRFPPCSEEPYIQIDADSSASSTFCLARETNENPINNSTTGSPNGYSEPKSHGIQTTRQFSQHTSIV